MVQVCCGLASFKCVLLLKAAGREINLMCDCLPLKEYIKIQTSTNPSVYGIVLI